MAKRDDDVGGPFVVWVDYGYDGWHPASYDSLTEAVLDNKYGDEWVVTKAIKPAAIEA